MWEISKQSRIGESDFQEIVGFIIETKNGPSRYTVSISIEYVDIFDQSKVGYTKNVFHYTEFPELPSNFTLRQYDF